MALGGWAVFVSYGREDAAWVRVLAANLHRAGFEVFFDEWELAGGDRVAGRLEEGIRGSVNGVLVVSPDALSRPWVREEYEALLRQAMQEPGRRLIPVLYADAELPVFLANRLWVDFRGAGTTGPEYEARLDQLVRALRGLPSADRPARDGAVQRPTGRGGSGSPAASGGRLDVMTGASGGADPGARPGWRWDVALSFASAQRDYVEQVAQALQARGLRCFYDADEQIELTRK
jgi:hypothetical protein